MRGNCNSCSRACKHFLIEFNLNIKKIKSIGKKFPKGKEISVKFKAKVTRKLSKAKNEFGKALKKTKKVIVENVREIEKEVGKKRV